MITIDPALIKDFWVSVISKKFRNESAGADLFKIVLPFIPVFGTRLPEDAMLSELSKGKMFLPVTFPAWKSPNVVFHEDAREISGFLAADAYWFYQDGVKNWQIQDPVVLINRGCESVLTGLVDAMERGNPSRGSRLFTGDQYPSMADCQLYLATAYILQFALQVIADLPPPK